MSLKLSKRASSRTWYAHFLHAKRYLLSLIKAGDAGSGSGMTVPMMNCLIERPFVDNLTYWLSNTTILYRTHVFLNKTKFIYAFYW